MNYLTKYLERGLIHKEIYNKRNTKNKEKFTANICEKWTSNKYTK